MFLLKSRDKFNTRAAERIVSAKGSITANLSSRFGLLLYRDKYSSTIEISYSLYRLSSPRGFPRGGHKDYEFGCKNVW